MLTETEALALIRKALTLHDAERPVPSHVSVEYGKNLAQHREQQESSGSAP